MVYAEMGMNQNALHWLYKQREVLAAKALSDGNFSECTKINEKIEILLNDPLKFVKNEKLRQSDVTQEDQNELLD